MSDPVLPPDATLRDAIAAIEHTRCFIAVVVAKDGKLLGILSDGDIRRTLLIGKSLESPAADAMTRAPLTASSELDKGEVLDFLLTRGVAAAPVVDRSGRFVRVAQIHDFHVVDPVPAGGGGYAAAVIMAGGEGRRLRPLTLDRPKPMVEIGGVPLLELQVRTIVRSGLRRIFISTNYLGHVIEDHFGDGSGFGAEIAYLRESQKLGTAGALSLLPYRPDGPILVINGDVLTRSDFGRFLSYHHESSGFVTVAAVVYRVDIPFGVLRLDGHCAVGLEEKPSQSFLCNAGMYVLSPDALDLVPKDTSFDMTDVIAEVIAAGRRVPVFPIHEYWTDIGSPSDLERAVAEFGPRKVCLS